MNFRAIHRSFRMVFCVLIFCCPEALGADSPDTIVTSNDSLVNFGLQERSSFLQTTLDDGQYFVSKSDFYFVVGALGAAPFVFRSAFDRESVTLNARLHRSPSLSSFFTSGDWLGQTSLQAGVAAVGVGVGKLTHSPKLQSFGSDIIRAQAFNAVITLSMKAITNRTRPNGLSHSYPSGHTSTSFASAGVIYSHFGKSWGAVAFLSASYVGLSRIEGYHHYLSDVISGAVIGSYVGLKIAHRSNPTRKLSIAPDLSFAHGGLAFAFQF